MGSHSYLPPGRGKVTCLYPGRYTIYPPIKDERLSIPVPVQVNDLPRVATKVLALPGTSWLSQPSAPLGIVEVCYNNNNIVSFSLQASVYYV